MQFTFRSASTHIHTQTLARAPIVHTANTAKYKCIVHSENSKRQMNEKKIEHKYDTATPNTPSRLCELREIELKTHSRKSYEYVVRTFLLK